MSGYGIPHRGLLFVHRHDLDTDWRPGPTAAPCPRCGAQVGQTCREPSGKRLDGAHQDRPGRTYAEAPKARMIVTRVDSTTVWYAYDHPVNGRLGSFRMSRRTWEADYA